MSQPQNQIQDERHTGKTRGEPGHLGVWGAGGGYELEGCREGSLGIRDAEDEQVWA